MTIISGNSGGRISHLYFRSGTVGNGNGGGVLSVIVVFPNCISSICPRTISSGDGVDSCFIVIFGS
jgi:hypothetical protein